MKVNVREFLGSSYNHGNYIIIMNNLPSKTSGPVYKELWKGEFETMDNYIPNDIAKLEVIKWGIENNSIVIYANYEEKEPLL